MPTEHVLFVVSEANSERRALLERRCLETASRQGFKARLLESSHGLSDWRERIVDGVRSAVAGGTRLVVAIGGDGTIGACAESLCNSGAALAVVPRGAANLFARALGLPFGFDAALAVAFRGSDRPVDVAFANGRAVVTMAGIGLDAAVVAATATVSKRALGWLGYGMATVPHLMDHPHRYEIRLDDGTEMTVNAQSIVVANSGVLPGGLAVSPQSRLDDGLLDVTLLAPRGPLGWPAVLWGMVQAGRRGVADRHLLSLPTRTVAISADRTLPRQLDGEPIPAGSDLAVRIAGRALTVRIPGA